MSKTKIHLSLFATMLLASAACGSEVGTEPGRAVGLQATTIGEEGKLVSNEFEVDLSLDGEAANQAVSGGAKASLAPVKGRILAAPSQSEQYFAVKQKALQLNVDAQSASCSRQPDVLRTHSGQLCWVSEKVGISRLGTERSITKILYFTPDGAYNAIVEATGIDTGIGLLGTSFSFGSGCIANPDPNADTISVSYLGDLLGLGFSTSILIYDFGITSFFTKEDGLQRGYQYDTGVSVDFLSFFPFFSFSVSEDKSSSFLLRPTKITGDCESTAAGDEDELFADTGGNPFVSISAGLGRLGQSGGSGYRDVMLQETAKSALVSVAPLTQTDKRGSQAALSQAFFSRSSSELCEDCSESSIDSFLFTLRKQLGESTGDGEQTKAVTRARFAQYQRSAPGAVPYAMAQRKGSMTLEFAFLATEEIAAINRGDSDRYISSEIIDVDAKVGEPALVSVSLEEVAQLVGVPAASLVGATCTVDGSPLVDSIDLELGSDGIAFTVTPKDSASILLRLEVDLTTALGPFPQEDLSDWVVRPSMRRILVSAGSPAGISLGAPVFSLVGEPTVLSALVVDENFSVVDDGVSVDFFDGKGERLGAALVESGVAQLSVLLSASTPKVESILPETLQQGGFDLEGIAIVGTGFSGDATVFYNGNSLDDLQVDYRVISSRKIFLPIDPSSIEGAHQLEIVNPGGQSSGILPDF